MIRLPAPTTLALLLALAQPATAATVAEGDELAEIQDYRFWLLDAVATLDPQKAAGEEAMDVIRFLFEGLMNEDASGAMVPGTATGYTLSDDRLTYVFTLNARAEWSDGTPVTAQDFVFAWRRLADPATASPSGWFIELMNVRNAAAIRAGELPKEELGLRALDDRRLEITLTRPTPYFVSMLGHPATFPVPRAQVETHGDGWTRPGTLTGNGAFTLAAHDPGAKISFAKNPLYHDAGNVILQSATGITINDQNTALTRYEAGDLDRFAIPAGQFPRLSERYPAEAVSLPRPCTYAYLVNLSEKGPEALKRPGIRRALSLALDRDAIVEAVLQGDQQPAYGWTPPGIAGLAIPESAAAPYPDRLAEAISLMEAAGYTPDTPLRLRLGYNSSDDHRRIAMALRGMWKGIGVEVSLSGLDWAAHAERLRSSDFDLARYGWCADYNEASTFLDYFRATGGNAGGFAHAGYDRLMRDAATSGDPNREYRVAEDILKQELPLIPVYHYARTEMIKPHVKGLPQGNVMNTWYGKDLYITAH